jgi:hypothetical protein
MENTSLSDALIGLIPTYGPWIIFGIVALESAGVPLPERQSLLQLHSLPLPLVRSASSSLYQHLQRVPIVGDGIGYMVGVDLVCPLFADTAEWPLMAQSCRSQECPFL